MAFLHRKIKALTLWGNSSGLAEVQVSQWSSMVVFYHVILIESFELDGSLKGHPVQFPINEQGHL